MVQVNPLDSSVPIEPLLQLEQVTLQTPRGDVSLLQNISCSLGAGEWVLLVGDAGSGKTLLFRLLTGLLSPTQGRILLQGQPIAQWPGPELRRRVAWVPRLPRLLGMSVKEAIAYPLQLQTLPETEIQRRLDAVLASLNLPLDWLAKGESELNLGQQWQVALARSLVLQPQILLLELPIADGTARTTIPQDTVAAIIPCLEAFQAQGGSLVMASRSPLAWNIAADAQAKSTLALTPALTQRWHLDRAALQSLSSKEPWPAQQSAGEMAQETQERWGDEEEDW